MPVHKIMQPACLADDVLAGTQVEMVGVTQDDLGVDLLHLPGGHGLDRSLGAHRHINGRGNIAVGRVQHAQARPGLLTGMEEFKGDGIAHGGLYSVVMIGGWKRQ